MKKSTKILICCVAAAAVIFGGIAYVFRPLTFEQAVGGIKTESIERIELLNGTTGIVSQTIEPEDIEEIYGKIASVKLRAALPEKQGGLELRNSYIRQKHRRICFLYLQLRI